MLFGLIFVSFLLFSFFVFLNSYFFFFLFSLFPILLPSTLEVIGCVPSNSHLLMINAFDCQSGEQEEGRWGMVRSICSSGRIPGNNSLSSSELRNLTPYGNPNVLQILDGSDMDSGLVAASRAQTPIMPVRLPVAAHEGGGGSFGRGWEMGGYLKVGKGVWVSRYHGIMVGALGGLGG